ncbi:NAD(P)-binding protein [Penicillium longicatenatum]|uniref:NAD(P)-binding protein n=1 Tax=Penicillium longicatenatum TaxID=1561947 RepID=UPI0025474284|nr:NAD(P)-binding protein [Penicillium longicatenatum]KAJ5657883.1 NAD(P)-binding protein [Penicillium longicatenatum]
MSDMLSPIFRLLPSKSQLLIPPPLLIGIGALGFVGLCSRVNSYLSRRALNGVTATLPWDSEREVVVVTGGSSGIGAAIVELLAHRGIKTLILDVTEPREELRSNTFFFKVDLAKAEAIKSIATNIRSEHGDPTVLINNAGIEFNKPLLGLEESQIRRTFDVNILAHFLLVQEFLPAMVSLNHGHVVSVASLASFTTSAINVDYALTMSSIFHPGWVRTPLIQKMVDSGVRDGQILEPRDVAEKVVNQIISGLGAQVFVPSSHWILPFVRALPCWAQEAIRNQLSVKRIAALT